MLFLMGQITFVTWDHRMILGPFCDGVLIAGVFGFREGQQTCFLTSVDPMVATILTILYDEDEPRKNLKH